MGQSGWVCMHGIAGSGTYTHVLDVHHSPIALHGTCTAGWLLCTK